MLIFFFWHWFYRCHDCGSRGCPVMRYGDEEQEHRWKSHK